MSDEVTSPDRAVIVVADRVTVRELHLADRQVAAHLESILEDDRAGEVMAAISIGVRGLAAMGTSAAAHRVGDAVERVVTDALARSEVRVGELLEVGRREMRHALDPEVRSSITARVMAELETVHRELLDGLDPERRGSRTARFVAELDDLLGPEGHFDQRLAAALDPAADGSALSGLVSTIERRFQELRDLIIGAEAQRAEARRGTAKGFVFEDVVESRLRAEARHLGGAIVERTSLESGRLGNGSIVGDCVVMLPDGTRIAVEAKHTSRIGLTGKDGILTELDRAMANRTATWGLCVSHDAAYPDEVGVLGLYGNRILVVDDGSGELIRVALRWIAAAARQNDGKGGGIDTDQLTAQLERLRALATRFSRTKRALTGVQSSIEAVRTELEELRTELLDGIDDTIGTLRPEPDAPSLVA